MWRLCCTFDVLGAAPRRGVGPTLSRNSRLPQDNSAERSVDILPLCFIRKRVISCILNIGGPLHSPHLCQRLFRYRSEGLCEHLATKQKNTRHTVHTLARSKNKRIPHLLQLLSHIITTSACLSLLPMPMLKTRVNANTAQRIEPDLLSFLYRSKIIVVATLFRLKRLPGVGGRERRGLHRARRRPATAV